MSGDHPRPQLSLGQPPESLRQKLSHVPRVWLWTLLLLQMATIGFLLFLAREARQAGPIASGSASPAGAQELKAAAGELEDRGLELEAARAWEAYLSAMPDEASRAEIFYRVGRLYLQAEQYGPAATALLRSQKAAGDDQELSRKIGPQLVECLRRMGRYGEVDRELSRRVETGVDPKTTKSKVLAKLSGQELTEADLDRMIQRRADDLLAMQGLAAEPNARASILKQMSNPAVRKRLFQEMLQSELFARRAQELGLDREESFVRARGQMVQGLLASRFLSRELEKIQPTEIDLQSFYQANTERYREPESLEAVWFKPERQEDGVALLAKTKSADDFRRLVASRRGPKKPGDEAKPRRIVRGGEDAELGKTDSLFELAEGQWTRKPHKGAGGEYLVLVEKKHAARTRPLEEVRSEVRSQYTARKQQELSEQLLRDLMSRYDVQITVDEAPSAGSKMTSEAAGAKKGP